MAIKNPPGHKDRAGCINTWGSVRCSWVLLHLTLLLAAILLARNRLEVDLDTAVLRPTVDVAVAGNRVVRACATGRQVGAADALGRQVRRDALGATLGQVHVVLAAAGAVGVADDFDLVLIELFSEPARLLSGW